MKNPFRKRFLDKAPALGRMLLGGWLVAEGTIPLLGLGSAALTTALNCVAVGAGVCLFLHR
jgi:hypothetical protein